MADKILETIVVEDSVTHDNVTDYYNDDVSGSSEKKQVIDYILFSFHEETISGIKDLKRNPNWKKAYYVQNVPEIMDEIDKGVTIRNLVIVHHAQTFGKINNQEIRLYDRWFNLLTDNLIMLSTSMSVEEIYKEMINNHTSYATNSTSEIMQTLVALHQLINCIEDKGNLYFIGCLEGNHEDSLKALGKFTSKEINIIANTNTSVIYTKSIFNEVNDVECGSILDIPLTIEFVDNKLRPLGKGFVKYNNKTLKLTSTSKDLLLRTHATPVKYIDNNTRKKFLEKNQYNQLFVLQAIHARNSKIFERTYTKLYGKEAYLLYIKQTDSIIKQYVGSY
jgi:hypothetical protein